MKVNLASLGWQDLLIYITISCQAVFHLRWDSADQD